MNIRITETPSPEFRQLMSDTVAVVEATSFEQYVLQRDLREGRQNAWKDMRAEQGMSGIMLGVGDCGGMQTCISLGYMRLDGHVIMFYEATSRIVDHGLVRIWVDANFHSSVTRTNADNFAHAIHAVQQVKAGDPMVAA